MRIPGTLLALLAGPLLAFGQQRAALPDMYVTRAAQAVRDGRPLVTFLACESRAVAGALTCSAQALPGYDGPAIVIAAPGSDWLNHRATLPATATDAEIAAAIR